MFKKSTLNTFASALTWHHNRLWRAVKVQDLFDYTTEPCMLAKLAFLTFLAKSIKDFQRHFALLAKWTMGSISKLEGKKKEAMVKNFITLCTVRTSSLISDSLSTCFCIITSVPFFLSFLGWKKHKPKKRSRVNSP